MAAMAENPYAPPQAEINAGAPAEIARASMKMPGTVIAAIVVVSIIALLSVLNLVRSGSILSLIGVAIYALILIGLIRGHALAWQWGIVIPTLFGILAAVGLFAGAGMGGLGLGELIILLIPLSLYLSIAVLLSRKSSRIFFGLQCPKCGAIKARARSFFFTKRRCGACKFEWTPVRR
jgi:hypothetical protein